MELMNMQAFKEMYPPWLDAARPLLEAANWKDSFKTYPFVLNEESPWSPLQKELSQCRIAVLTTAGLYIEGEQPPFNAADIEGDWTFRELPGDIALDRLAISHDHYDHTSAEADLNSVYPMERLAELQREGVIGELAARHYSISGYCTRADLLVENTVPRIVERVRQDNVDVLFHIPV